MKLFFQSIGVAAALLISFAIPTHAQELTADGSVRGRIIVPASSVEHRGDAGVRFHTNYEIFVPARGFAPETAGPPARLRSPDFPLKHLLLSPASMVSSRK